MRFHGLLATLSLSVALAAPLSAYANHAETVTPAYPEPALGDNWDFSDGLSHNSKKNLNLETGEYAFGDFHKTGKSFMDTWSFTLADASDVTINLFDFALPGAPNFLYQDGGDDKLYKKGQWSKHLFETLLDNKLLSISLFDANDNLLGTAGENGTISAMGLNADTHYTLAVSGKAVGLLGGIYHGTLNVGEVAPVPLGDSLPFFASALAVFGLRSKKVRAALAS